MYIDGIYHDVILKACLCIYIILCGIWSAWILRVFIKLFCYRFRYALNCKMPMIRAQLGCIVVWLCSEQLAGIYYTYSFETIVYLLHNTYIDYYYIKCMP